MWIPLAASAVFDKNRKAPEPAQPLYRYTVASEPVASVVRRIPPADLVLTDQEAEAIMDRARADAAKRVEAAIHGDGRSERAYQTALSVSKQKQALKAQAELQDEAWRGCVAAYVSDSD